MTLIIRTANNTSHTGRTLEGVAFDWETPVLVNDDGRRSYFEEFDRTCCDATLSVRSRLALGVMHPWSPEPDGSTKRVSQLPVGAVDFTRSAEGLVFIARLSRTREGDEALELLNDGALGDVSIGAKAVRSASRYSPRGTVVRRMEIALRELSLAPPGMGARPEAKVLVMRTATVTAGTPRLDHLTLRLRALSL